ncbi:amidohydrolase [Hyphomonas sp. ND6WE1B]|uniref:amidohydrolase family protein n=1 Tax=Hyphomonas sp. ND6WE1B TaxID=1848191 RepID=UPI0008075CE6|nr:amidohydrolase family protein [Hyphomonas sp. ND6WE1B]
MESNSSGWVDTHVHFFNRKGLTYSWLETIGEPWTGILGDYSPLAERGDYTLDQYLAEALPSGVTKIVHAEAAFGSDPAAESAWLQSLANLGKIPIAIVGHAALGEPDVEATLDMQMENANFRGVRMLWGAGGAESPSVMAGFRALVDRDLCFEEPFAWENLDGLSKFAKAFPGAKIVIGHCGMPMKRDPESLASWKAAMTQLSEYEGVYCKISGVHMTDHNWTFESVREIVETCIETFGPARCFFGSNWPVDSLYGGSLVELVDDYRTIIRGYSASEQEAMMSGNASRFYRI